MKIVESRQNLSSCSPMKEVVGDWPRFGSDAVRERLFRALLPFIKIITFVPAITLPMYRMIKEIGAPCLEELRLHKVSGSSLLPLIEALNSLALPSLTGIGLYMASLDTA